jgi:hypothetical protein
MNVDQPVSFAPECFEAAALVHATKLKRRSLTLENKSKACQMFVAIEIQNYRIFMFELLSSWIFLISIGYTCNV